MAVAKSILDIEVNDQAFQRYRDLFQKYQEEVAKLPDAWATVGQQTKAAGNEFQKIAAAMLTHAHATTDIIKAQSRSAVLGDRQVRQWRSLADSSKKAAANFAHMARSLLRMSTITGAVTGLLGGGGLFGIDRLAQNASSWRRSALGLGTSIGAQRAFGLNFGRVIEPGAFLSGVNAAMHDVTKRVALSALGIGNTEGRDTTDVAADALQRVKTLVDKTPEQFLGQLLTSQRLGELGLSLEDLERIRATPKEELNDYFRSFRGDMQNLNLTRAQAKAWQDLQVQLSRAGQTIETTLINGLTPLKDPLEKLSVGFTDLVKALLSNPHMKEWIDDVAAGLEAFAKYLKSDKLKTDVDWAIEQIHEFGEGLKEFVTWWRDHMPPFLGGKPYEEPAPGQRRDNTETGSPVTVPPQRDGQPSSGFTRAFPWLIPSGGLVIHRGNATTEWGRQNLPVWLGGNDVRPVPGVRQEQLDEWSKNAVYISRDKATALEDQEAAKQGVPVEFARRIFQQEGGLNPDGSPRVSRAGAIGAGQLMPGTALQWHVNPADTAQNIHGSVEQMRYLLDLFHGDQRAAAAAYNLGEGRVRNLIHDWGPDWLSHAPEETRKYALSFPDTGAEVRKYAGTPAPAQVQPSQPHETENEKHLNETLKRLRRSIQAQNRSAGGVRVVVQNQTGGNAIVTAGQLAV